MGLLKKRELRIAQEASFMESADDPASVTWTVSATVLRPKLLEIDTSGLKRNGVPNPAITGDLRLKYPNIPTTYSDSTVKFKMIATGLGSAATGSLTETEQGKILEWVLGGKATTDGTTVAGAGSTTTTTDVTSAASHSIGEFIHIDKEVRRITAISGTTLTHNHAWSGAPADTTVVNGCAAYFPTEANPDSLRMLIFGDTGDAADQIMCFGCSLSKLTLEMAQSAYPTITFEFNVAYWTQAAYSATFTTAAFNDKTPHSVGGAGAFFNESGTTTRNNLQVDRFTFEPILTLAKNPSASGGKNIEATDVQAWKRTDVGGTFSFVTPFALDWYTRWRSGGTTAWNIHYQTCPTAGKGFTLYLPTVYPSEEPTREGIGDSTGFMVKGFCVRGADTAATTDIAYAPFVLVQS